MFRLLGWVPRFQGDKEVGPMRNDYESWSNNLLILWVQRDFGLILYVYCVGWCTKLKEGARVNTTNEKWHLTQKTREGELAQNTSTRYKYQQLEKGNSDKMPRRKEVSKPKTREGGLRQNAPIQRYKCQQLEKKNLDKMLQFNKNNRFLCTFHSVLPILVCIL